MAAKTRQILIGELKIARDAVNAASLKACNLTERDIWLNVSAHIGEAYRNIVEAIIVLQNGSEQ